MSSHVTLTDDDVPATASVPRRRGAALGRYIVLEQLGEGGMGVVYAAYDPELDRKLAVKLLRDDAGSGTAANRRARLLREAQALARLGHPNVVTVYDVGALDDQIFVAMELITGQTVAAWLDEQRHDLPAILQVFGDAGRGLAAAHALGIVHRDFKPENVLIDRSGRVRVVDFGLARTASDAANPPASASAVPDWEHVADGRPAMAETLTRTGALLGTPGYIAPEQVHGPTTAAADQFGFCVALWKALHGELPFAGDTAGALASAAAAGQLRVPARRIPARVHRVLVRGLAPAPEDRFASMDELLAALIPVQARRRYTVAAACAVAGIAVAVPLLRGHDAGPPPCQAPELGRTWDWTRRFEIARAFAGTGLAYALITAEGVDRVLDRYATSWQAMRTDACEATRVRGEQSAQLLDRRISCLDDRARDLQALTSVFAQADANTVERALQAAMTLRPIADCANTAALESQSPLPGNPVVRAQIAQLRSATSEARALALAGRVSDAVARATPIVAAAHRTHDRPTEAAALAVLGSAQRDAGDLPGAQRNLEAAVTAAIAARDDETAADAAAVLVRLVGYDRGKHDDVESWIAMAEAFLEARPDDRVRAQLENNIGIVRFGQDRYDEALVHYETSRALRERLYGADSPLVAASLDNIALVLDRTGDTTRGSALHRRALAIESKVLGPTHPGTVMAMTNLAVSLRMRGEYTEALEIAQRAVTIKEAVYGPESATVAMSLNEVGNIAYFQHDYAKAAAVFERALAIKQKTLGKHSSVAAAMSNLAEVYEKLHRYDEALALDHKALAMRVELLGPTHSDVAQIYMGLGELAMDRGNHDDAFAQYSHAVAIWQPTLGADNPLVASAEMGIGDAELARGHAAAALAAYTRAAAIDDKQAVDIADRARAHFGIAKALRATGDRGKARREADDARALYQQAGARGAGDLASVDTWLRDHR